jgi:DNA-binding HxlR family transcriptional regulator
MRWLEVDPSNCSVQRTLDVIGDRWSLLVLREAFNGVRRFDDIAAHLGVSQSVLARRLQALVDGNVLARSAYREAGRRTRHEYRLTEQGRELFPVITALMQWGDRYLADDAGPAWSVRHHDCGAPIETVARCTTDHQALDTFHTRTTAGPGARALPTPPPATSRPGPDTHHDPATHRAR